MKQIMLTLTLSILGIYSFAQVDAISDDTTHIRIGKTTISITNAETDSANVSWSNSPDDPNAGEEEDEKDYSDRDYANWAGFSLGVNGFLTSDNKIELPESQELFDIDYAKSLNVNLNILEKRFEIGTRHIGLTTGLGFEFNRYEFKRNVSLSYTADSTWAQLDSLPTYDKNFLKATYIQVPLLLDFSTASRTKQSVSIAAGVIAGVRIGSKTKYKYYTDGDKNKDKVSADYNLNPFKLSATARLTMGNYTLFANYGLTSLFQKDKGPDLTAFSVGLSIIPF